MTDWNLIHDVAGLTVVEIENYRI